MFKLNQQTVTAYCWTENEYPKDSKKIASCVFGTLQNTNVSQYVKIGLITGGCRGQNKNFTLIETPCAWLASASENLREVDLVFLGIFHC